MMVATLEQLLLLLRAQRAAGFFSFLKLQEHIDAVTAQLTGRPPVERGVVEWVGVLFQAIPLLWWQLLFLGLWGVLLLRAVVWWQKKRFFSLISLTAALMLIAPCVWVRYRLSTAHVVVIEKDALLRSGPGETFVQMGTLKVGEQGVIEGEYSPRPETVFAKIVVGEKRGWIDKSTVGIV